MENVKNTILVSRPPWFPKILTLLFQEYTPTPADRKRDDFIDIIHAGNDFPYLSKEELSTISAWLDKHPKQSTVDTIGNQDFHECCSNTKRKKKRKSKVKAPLPLHLP